MIHAVDLLFLVLIALGVLGFLARPYLAAATGRRGKVFFAKFFEQVETRPRTIRAFIWLLGLIPMLRMLYVVRQYGINIPTLDDWDIMPLVVKAHRHQLAFADLFQQQQEGRTILPKLIFVLSSFGGHLDMRPLMFGSVLSCCLIALGIFVLLRRSGLRSGALALCYWVSVLTIFSFAQYELWIFASGFPSFLPALFLVAALLALTSRISTTAKFFICALLSIVSSFTLPHGLLLWGLTFPVGLIVSPLLHWRRWLAGWLAVAAACAAFYFWGYEKPGYLPQFAPPAPPIAYLKFVLIFLGGELSYAKLHYSHVVSILAGSILVAIFLATLSYTIMRRGDRAYLAKVMPWYALGSYSIGSACLAVMGRIGYGPYYAFASRYVTFSLYLTVADIALIAITASRLFVAHPTRPWRITYNCIWVPLLFAYLLAYQSSSLSTFHFFLGYAANDRLARAAVQLSQVMDTTDAIRTAAYPSEPANVVRRADELDRLHLLDPPLLRTLNLQGLADSTIDNSLVIGCHGKLRDLDLDTKESSGWSFLIGKARQPDCIIIAQELPGQLPVPIAISKGVEPRPDIAKRLRMSENIWVGWTAIFLRKDVPAGAKISYWAYDARLQQVYKFAEISDAMPQ